MQVNQDNAAGTQSFAVDSQSQEAAITASTVSGSSLDTSGVLPANVELTRSEQRLRMLMERHNQQAGMARGSGVTPYVRLVSQDSNQ